MTTSRRLPYDNVGRTSAKAIGGVVVSGRMSGKTGSKEFSAWLQEDLKKRKPDQEELDDQVREMKRRRKRNQKEGQRKRRKEMTGGM